MTAQTATEPQPPEPSSRLARVLAPARRIHPVWGLNVAIIAAVVALYAGPVHGLQPLAHPYLPWWAIAIAFAIAERCVVHLHFRRGAHSFSLGDIPLVFGLIFSSAESFGLGCLLGCGVVLLLDRRLPPVKFAFNIAQLALHACIALLVVHALAPVGAHVDTRTWVSALIATQVSSLVGSALILAAISLSEGLVNFRTLIHMLSMDLVVTTSNASLALCGAVIMAEDAHALPLLLVPAATLFAAYRAYLSERERHKRLEFLYEANRTLARSREIAHALEGLLVRSLEAFRAEIAEIILFGSEENPSLRTLLGPGSYRELMEPVDSEVADEMHDLLDRSGSAITLDRPFGGGRLQRYLEARGVTHAMLAPLPGEERVIGAIMLANRFGVVRSFDHDDLRLLDTLAGNASVALQYDRLEQAVTQLSVLQEQLHHQAYHDPLTSLANRTLFTDKVKEAIAERRGELGDPSDDSVAPWSSRGTTEDGTQKPDVYAPGAHIVSVLAPNSVFATSNCSGCVVGGGQYIQTSGTSMAAPVIAGLVADLLQVHPRWTPAQVKGVLTSAAVSGNGSLQEPNAVKAVLDWNARVADQGLTPSKLIDPATGAVNLAFATWNFATWNRATGDLRADYANSSYSCKTCAANTGGTVDSSLGTWGLGTWGMATWNTVSLSGKTN